jgi:heme A synthase
MQILIEAAFSMASTKDHQLSEFTFYYFAKLIGLAFIRLFKWLWRKERNVGSRRRKKMKKKAQN